MVSSGILTTFLLAFTKVLAAGLVLLKPFVLGWLSFLVLTELVRTMAASTVQGNQGPAVIKFVLRAVIWGTVIFNFPTLADVIVKRFIGVGLFAGGSVLDIATFLDPGSYLEQGFVLGKLLNEAFTDNTAIDGLVAAFFFLVCWAVFILSFAWMGVCVLLLQIELALGVLGAAILLPAVLVRGMGWMAAGAVSYPVNAGFKFFIMALVVSIVTPLMKEVVGVGATWESGLTMLIGALVMAYLFTKSSSLASGILSGTPSLGVGGLVQTLVLGTSVLAGGAALGGAVSRTLARGGATLVNNLGGTLPVPALPPAPARQVLMQSLAQSSRYLHSESSGHGPTPHV